MNAAVLAGARLAQARLDVVPTNGLVGLYDFTRMNLLSLSEGPISNMTVKGGTPLPTSLPGSDGFSEWFGFAASPSASQYAYAPAPPLVVNQSYTLSVYVRMDDGGAPVFSGFNDPNASFCLVLFGSASVYNPTVTHLGDGLYRVSATRDYPSTNQLYLNNGVIKYVGQQARGFKATGYQMVVGTKVLAYERTIGPQEARDTSVRGTNILASDDMTGAAYNRVGMTVTATGTLPSGSRTYKLTYPDGGSSSPYIISIPSSTDASALTQRTVRVLARRISGTGSVRLRTGAGVPDLVMNLTSEWQEFTVTQDGGTQRYFLLARLNNFGVDEIEVSEPMLNMGPYVPYEHPPNHGMLGTAVNSDSNDPIWSATGAGLTFDGVDDSVEIPGGWPAGPRTVVAVWTNLRNATAYQVIVGNASQASNYIALSPTKTIRTAVYQSGTGGQGGINSSNPTAIGVPHFTAFTDSGTELRQYLDSTPVMAASFPSIPPAGTMRLGLSTARAEGLNGVIHLIFTYNRVLSDREITTLQRYARKRLARVGLALS